MVCNSGIPECVYDDDGRLSRYCDGWQVRLSVSYQFVVNSIHTGTFYDFGPDPTYLLKLKINIQINKTNLMTEWNSCVLFICTSSSRNWGLKKLDLRMLIFKAGKNRFSFGRFTNNSTFFTVRRIFVGVLLPC